MKYITKNIKDVRRRMHKSFRRNVGTPQGYQKPIVKDAFVFAGPEISEKKAKEYFNLLGVDCEKNPPLNPLPRGEFRNPNSESRDRFQTCLYNNLG